MVVVEREKKRIKELAGNFASQNCDFARGSLSYLGSLDPLMALVVSFAFLGMMVYKRVNLGVTLTSTAILLSLLTMEFAACMHVALLYMSAYLGYLGASTHLCLVLTADYFKCPLGRLYRYMIPSLIISFAAAISVYFLI